ncbi:hypothetical protein FHS23_001053 [Prauserella isguenensis]|uniref:Uncharacterized protein n=1 Tax=Prauserella isguenensis TaxID=1470180 RepID=A0A839RWM9_9PSEU|nr:hypothetical protein [Prauserella isguenensis]MBB3050058.1 hypothetical protein [Prauserella isguenensis]
MDDGARTGTDADGGAELNEVAAELYALDRDEFTQARNERARSAGDRELAARIRKLRKPTVAAARVNRFAREHPDQVRQLRTLGDELRSAHAELDGDRIRELSQRRRALVGESAELEASGSGDGVSREVHDTLDAAVTDADAGEAVARGCLVSALQPGDAFAAGGLAADVDGGGTAAPVTHREGRSDDEVPNDDRAGGAERSRRKRSSGRREPADGSRSGGTDRSAQTGRQDREHRDKKQQRRERNRHGRLREQERQDSPEGQPEKERREQERREQERREEEQREQRERERRERERREERRREQRERRRQRNAELAEARTALGDAVTELREAEAAEAEARRRARAARKAFEAADRRVHEAEVALAEVTDAHPDQQ